VVAFRDRRRWASALPIALGGVLWALGDYHGIAVLVGGVVGVALGLATDAGRAPAGKAVAPR
jgi:hypothetical protein